MLASVQKPENKKYQGQRMDEIARAKGRDPVDALCDLLISEEAAPYAIFFGMSEPDVELAMKQPWVAFGSDGVAVNPSMEFMGVPHPRFYGTFPRVLGVYVRDRHVLTLPDAIRKMTSLAAQIAGFTDRGLLRPGMAADMAIFDPDGAIKHHLRKPRTISRRNSLRHREWGRGDRRGPAHRSTARTRALRTRAAELSGICLRDPPASFTRRRQWVRLILVAAVSDRRL